MALTVRTNYPSAAVADNSLLGKRPRKVPSKCMAEKLADDRWVVLVCCKSEAWGCCALALLACGSTFHSGRPKLNNKFGVARCYPPVGFVRSDHSVFTRGKVSYPIKIRSSTVHVHQLSHRNPVVTINWLRCHFHLTNRQQSENHELLAPLHICLFHFRLTVRFYILKPTESSARVKIFYIRNLGRSRKPPLTITLSVNNEIKNQIKSKAKLLRRIGYAQR